MALLSLKISLSSYGLPTSPDRARFDQPEIRSKNQDTATAVGWSLSSKSTTASYSSGTAAEPTTASNHSIYTVRMAGHIPIPVVHFQELPRNPVGDFAALAAKLRDHTWEERKRGGGGCRRWNQTTPFTDGRHGVALLVLVGGPGRGYPIFGGQELNQRYRQASLKSPCPNMAIQCAGYHMINQVGTPRAVAVGTVVE